MLRFIFVLLFVLLPFSAFAADEGDGAPSQDTTATGIHHGKNSYDGISSKIEVNMVPTRDWWIAASVSNAWHREDGPGLLNDHISASTEVKWRTITRSPENPINVTLDIEPQWSHNSKGQDSATFNTRVLADATVIHHALYWSGSIGYSPSASSSGWSAGTSASTAFTYSFTPKFFIGVETRLVASFNDVGMNHFSGYGVFIGPTISYKIADHVTVSGAFEPQIAGHHVGGGGRLNTVDFERNTVRAKLAIDF